MYESKTAIESRPAVPACPRRKARGLTCDQSFQAAKCTHEISTPLTKVGQPSRLALGAGRCNRSFQLLDAPHGICTRSKKVRRDALPTFRTCNQSFQAAKCTHEISTPLTKVGQPSRLALDVGRCNRSFQLLDAPHGICTRSKKVRRDALPTFRTCSRSIQAVKCTHEISTPLTKVGQPSRLALGAGRCNRSFQLQIRPTK